MTKIEKNKIHIEQLKQCYEEIKNRNIRDFESWRGKCLILIEKINGKNSEVYLQFSRLSISYFLGDFELVYIRFEESLKNIITLIEIEETTLINESVKMTNRIFISHSSIDAKIMEIFVDFLINIFENLKRSDIICTSVDGCDIEVGVDIYEFIKDQSNKSSITIGMISKSSIKSETVLFEFGIAWSLDKLIPVIIEKNYDFKDLPKPIGSKKCLKLFDISDLNKLIEFLEKHLKLTRVDINNYEKLRNEFIEKYSLILEKQINFDKENKNSYNSDWKNDMKFFLNEGIFESFDLLYQDSIHQGWHNHDKYEKYLPIFTSKNLIEIVDGLFVITDKGKYYYSELYDLYNNDIPF